MVWDSYEEKLAWGVGQLVRGQFRRNKEITACISIGQSPNRVYLHTRVCAWIELGIARIRPHMPDQRFMGPDDQIICR